MTEKWCKHYDMTWIRCSLLSCSEHWKQTATHSLKTQNDTESSCSSPPHLISINNLHHTLLEKLWVNLAGDGCRFLHQGQLSVFLHRHRVGDHSTDVHLQAEAQYIWSRQKREPNICRAGQCVGIAPHLLQSLSRKRVIPALHVISWEFVFAEHAHPLALSAASDRLDHLVKVALVALILKDKEYTNKRPKGKKIIFSRLCLLLLQGCSI